MAQHECGRCGCDEKCHHSSTIAGSNCHVCLRCSGFVEPTTDEGVDVWIVWERGGAYSDRWESVLDDLVHSDRSQAIAHAASSAAQRGLVVDPSDPERWVGRDEDRDRIVLSIERLKLV